MGGALLIVQGASKQEARKKLEKLLQEAEAEGLYEGRKGVVKYNPDQKVWEGYVGVHT